MILNNLQKKDFKQVLKYQKLWNKLVRYLIIMIINRYLLINRNWKVYYIVNIIIVRNLILKNVLIKLNRTILKLYWKKKLMKI